MASEIEIKEFLLGTGDGSGYEDGYEDGYGDGSGYGDGNGSGSGYEYGNGDGSGDGSGYEYGSRNRNRNGNGDGYGDGSGYGDGNGSGYGYGDGNGYGDGYGDGSRYGDGNGNGNEDGYGDESRNLKIRRFRGSQVYYVDNIPCIFESVHENYAVIAVIDTNFFEPEKAFIGKFKNCLSHGETVKDAIRDARSKYYQSLDFNKAKAKLLSEFEIKGRLTVKELYDWHGILTGSCSFGRTQFQQAHVLEDDDLLSLEEFVNLTKDAYRGDRIASLLKS